MSHTVTVTRTTTSTTTSAILLNVGYIKTVPGILKLLHIILGSICVGIVGYYISYHKYNHNYTTVRADNLLFVPELFFLLIATTCLIVSTLLLFSAFISIATATILPKTIFEVVYHITASVLLMLASIIYVIELQHAYQFFRGTSTYNWRLAAGEPTILAPLLALLFIASVVLIHEIVSRNTVVRQSKDLPYEPGYHLKIFAGVLGIFNAILYIVASVFAYRTFRRG